MPELDSRIIVLNTIAALLKAVAGETITAVVVVDDGRLSLRAAEQR